MFPGAIMGSKATLYEVQGTHGTVYVYAIHDSESGMLWTERSEAAARSLAKEKGLTISAEESITRTQLLRLMGQEVEETPAPQPQQTKPEPPKAQVLPVQSGTQPHGLGSTWLGCKVKSGGASLPVAQDHDSTPASADEQDEDEIVVSHAPTKAASLFCGEKPLTPPEADQ